MVVKTSGVLLVLVGVVLVEFVVKGVVVLCSKETLVTVEVAGVKLVLVVLSGVGMLLLPGDVLKRGGRLVGEEDGVPAVSVVFLVTLEVKTTEVDAGVPDVSAELASVVAVCSEVVESIVVTLLTCGVLVVKAVMVV